jgi:hypothetical protein
VGKVENFRCREINKNKNWNKMTEKENKTWMKKEKAIFSISN